MQKTVTLAALLATAQLLFADVPIVSPPARQDSPWFHMPSPAAPADDGTQTGTVIPFVADEVDWGMASGRPGQGLRGDDLGSRVAPFMDWGNDSLIGVTSTLPTLGRLSSDAAQNGDIYVGVLDPSGTNEDTVYVWRSSNGGLTWDRYLRFGSNVTNGGIDDYVLRVGSDANGNWVYHFLLYNASAAGGIWVYRHRWPYVAGGWTHIVPGGDTLRRIAADRNTETPQHLFIGYETSSNGIWMMSSKDTAETWGNATYVSSNRHFPAICAGADKYVYCAYYDNTDSTFFRVGRHTSNLEASGTWTFVNPHTDPDRRYRELSIAANRTGTGPTQTAICLAVQKYIPNGNIYTYYGWTTTGGAAWSANFWPPTNQIHTTWDYRDPYIRRSYHDANQLFRAVVTGPEPSQNWDTLVYAYSRPTSPTTWEERGKHNDHRMTGEFAANVDHSSRNSGGYIAYREFGAANIWFDGYTYTGVAEGRTPQARNESLALATLLGTGGALNLSLASPATLRAVLYDGAGQRAAVVFDGRLDAGEHRLRIPTGNLSQGVYFLALDIDGRVQTVKLVRTH